MSPMPLVPSSRDSVTKRIVGDAPVFRRAVALAERVAPTESDVLLKGATGTGKELFARLIHEQSRRPGRFVPVNCGALPPGMVESLLFGHRKGAFTDAREDAVGLVEAAQRGTLYLDELASLPVEGQVKLLRVLEAREVYRVGETEPRPVDLRVIGAIQEEPFALVAARALRQDLCERLAGVVIRIPTLRERDGDAWILGAFFAQECERTLSCDVQHVLNSHAWPGNVRELRLAIRRAVVLSDEVTISPQTLIEAIELGAGAIVDARLEGIAACERVRTQERARILAACEAHAWHAGRTAAALGITRVTLYRRLRALGFSLRAQKRLRVVSPVGRNNGNEYGAISG